MFRLLSTALALGVTLAAWAQPPIYVQDSTYDESRLLATLSASPTGNGRALDTERLRAAGTLLLKSKSLPTRRLAFDSISAAALRIGDWPARLDDSASTLPGIRALDLPGSALRLLTWQLFVNDSTYRYGGVLHDYEQGAATLLTDTAQQLGLEREYELSPDQWYGALYYAAHPFTLTSGKPAWVLFGYDADGFLHRRKVADVLHFGRRGNPLFGAEVFRGVEGQPDYTFSRLILEYRVDARVGLRYDEALGGIAFDRLVTGPPVVPGAPPSQIPDGSYDGYVLDAETGLWNYREEWFDRVMSAEPPRPKPVLGNQPVKRDLFGRERPPRKG